MANEVYITVIGRLTADLEAKVTKAGKPMATGSLAHNVRVFNRQTNQWEDGDANFYNITMFEPTASNALATLSKGTPVIAYGKQVVRRFQRKDGSSGTSVDITVSNIGPDLTFRQAQIIDPRNNQGGYSQGGGNQGGYGQPQNGGYQNQGQPQNGGYQNQGTSAGQDPWAGGDQAAQNDPFTNAAPGGDQGQDAGFSGW